VQTTVTEVPLGAVWDGHSVQVGVYSHHATSIDLCVFADVTSPIETQRIPLERSGDLWHATLRGAGPGLVYGLRVDGPATPDDGHHFDSSLVLLDPYSRAIAETFSWATGRRPRGVVINDTFDWRDDVRPQTPWTSTLIYELHVKGFTARHPDVPEALRGTYAGLATPAAIAHLSSLGVTAVELMPVHARADEHALHARGLTNYWGYNTLGFFAPEPRLAAATTPQGVVDEFKAMVRALHAAGIEVLLDVVYNHTAERDDALSTWSLRGLDNAGYYRLHEHDRSRYEDVTGCGNTLDTRRPHVRRLILDSLRYWVREMHVDGFRFDLASALIRGDHGVDSDAPLLREIQDDPVLSTVKLIAEPWDATAEGYRVGGFPAGWSEWNGRYRDDVRRYWRGEPGTRAALATRIAGSSDLYGASGRGPTASINFVTSHDGFTLADLVSYDHKHNLANGEDNRDGDNHNLSHNHGVEGPTDDPAIRTRRAQQQRNMLVTLFASQGVPMLSGGDELGRTQHGNNNAYCHDSEMSWTPWTADQGADLALLMFVQILSSLRRATPALRRNEFFSPDDHTVRWLRLDGTPMTPDDWNSHGESAFLLRLDGDHPLDVVFTGTSATVQTRR